jgi:cellulose 1,4-beta-cellobiosidase
MRLFNRLSGRRRITALVGVGALALVGSVVVPTAAYAAPGCQITYQAGPWTEGSGVGGYTANITIQNTGDPLTSWTLAFALPSGQTFTNGWGATWSGSTSLSARNLDWNGNLATGASTTIGFNGRWSGAYANPPASAFTLNGTACNGGGGPGNNTPPTVSLTSPTNNQVFPANAQIPLAATASDTGGVARVEFLIDGTVVGTDTTSPYTFAAPAVSTGAHTAAARAVDNGNPALSTTSTSVPFTVQAAGTPSIIVTPPSLTLAGGASGPVNVRLSAFTSNVTVNIARTGSTALSCTPTSIPFTSANWQAGVTVTCTAAAGTAAATATFTASGTGLTSGSWTVSRGGSGGGTRAANPYAGATGYVNPQWRANAMAEPGGSRIANQPTGVWFDRISALSGNGSPTTGTMGLVDHLDEAVAQDAANGASPLYIQIVVYNLPGRDCAALASNGELGVNDLPRYKAEYIDVMAEMLSRPAYANLRIVAVIEIDSLPNLVTNTGGRATATATCNTMLQNRGYVDGVGYALAKLGAIPNVYNYIDAAHHGWIGWDDNFGPTADIMRTAAQASGVADWASLVHGFITNTANTSALTEQFVGPVTEQLRNTPWIDFNRYNEELAFAQAFRTRLIQAGFTGGGSDGIGMLIDTSRNGWGNCVMAPCAAGGRGATRPTAPSTATNLTQFVNESRIDRRIHKGNWCNQAGAGLGERPRAAPVAGIDAYVWIKPPGESDGSSTEIPNEEGKGFDRMCDPTYGGNARNGNNMSGALPNAPLSGHWFSAQFQQLMANAFPPL